MTTRIRPKISKRNKYWIDKHRHYELKHFCLQYPEWKRLYLETDGYIPPRMDAVPRRANIPVDSTYSQTAKRLLYLEKIRLVEQTAEATDEVLAPYILRGVTEGLGYTYLKTTMDIPCSKDTYYDRYRRFFWLLDHSRK